jgi:hypothetical protein
MEDFLNDRSTRKFARDLGSEDTGPTDALNRKPDQRIPRLPYPFSASALRCLW